MKMKNKYYLVEVTLLAEIDKYSSWLHSELGNSIQKMTNSTQLNSIHYTN